MTKTMKKSMKSRMKNAATLAAIMTSAAVGKVAGGEVQQAGNQGDAQGVTLAMQGATKDDVRNQINAVREFEPVSPFMTRFFDKWLVKFIIGDPENIKGTHFPRSPDKWTELKYNQTVRAVDAEGRCLAEEFRDVVEHTGRKLYFRDPDTRTTKFASSYYDEEGNVYMTSKGKRTQHFHKDWGHGTHEPHNARAVTIKATATTSYMGDVDKAPWGLFIKIANGDVTEGVTKIVKKNKTVYVFEDASLNPDTKTSFQTKSKITVKKDGSLQIESVTVNAEQAEYPQKIYVNYTTGKMRYSLSPDGQVNIFAKMKERDRMTQENPCWGLDRLARRFVRRWAKKVGMIYNLPYPGTPPRYHEGKNAKAQEESTPAIQTSYILQKPQQPKEFTPKKGHFYEGGKGRKTIVKNDPKVTQYKTYVRS